MGVTRSIPASHDRSKRHDDTGNWASRTLANQLDYEEPWRSGSDPVLGGHSRTLAHTRVLKCSLVFALAVHGKQQSRQLAASLSRSGESKSSAESRSVLAPAGRLDRTGPSLPRCLRSP